MKTRGMTVYELAISLTVVFILVAISVVGIRAGIRSSKDSVSIQNLKQLHVASTLYSQDNNGFLPPFVTYHNDSKLPVITPSDRIANHPASKWKQCLLTFKTSDSTFYAPLDPLAKSPNSPPFRTDHLVTSYEHHFLVFEKKAKLTGSRVLSFDEVEKPAETAHLMEASIGTRKAANGSTWAVPYNETSNHILTFDGSVQARAIPN